MSTDYSKEELEALTTIYDKYWLPILEKAKDTKTLEKIKKVFTDILEKNKDKLQTNIVGRQVSISMKDEISLLEVIGLNHDDVEKTIKESPFFKALGELKLTAQLVLAVPLILLALAYTKLKKEEEAKFVYFITFIKPYASRISYFFGKYGVNEDQMLYTIENLSERYDIKKYGTIFSVLIKMAENSFNNYYKTVNKNTKFTDKDLYVIYTSGVGSRVNGFIGNPKAGIISEYMKNKGKYLSFEDSSVAFEDDDGTDFEYRDIASDSAIKAKVVSAVLTKANKDPIDRSALLAAAQFGMKSTSEYSLSILKSAIEGAMNNMHKDMSLFFTSMISAFLFTTNPYNGKKYTAADLRTPVFLSVMTKKIYNSPNAQDKNVIIVREMLEKMLVNYCNEYEAGKVSTKNRGIKNALFFYWSYLILKSARGN